MGGALVATAVPFPSLEAESIAVVPLDVTKSARLIDIFLTAKSEGMFSIRRASDELPLIHLGIGEGSTLRWVAQLGDEPSLHDGIASLVIEGDVDSWSAIYEDADGVRKWIDDKGDTGLLGDDL